MKRRLIITMVMVLVFALVAVGCNKDKEIDEPTTTEKITTTEPTTFVVPEIKDEPTTEETTEETTKEVETTKTQSYSGGNSSSGNSGSSNKKPVSTTKASSSNSGTFNGNKATVDENGNTFISNGQGTGGIMIPSNFEDLQSDEIVTKGNMDDYTVDEGADKAKLE